MQIILCHQFENHKSMAYDEIRQASISSIHLVEGQVGHGDACWQPVKGLRKEREV